MKLAIIGTGYVGLVTGACLAETGHTVYCIDNNEAKINALQAGEIPIFEPGLEDLVVSNVVKERLFFGNRLSDVINEVDVLFLAVGTPPKRDYRADLSSVKEVSKEIGKYLNKHLLIVTKSTVPVGTSELVSATIKKNQAKPQSFDVASNPEFLREGAAVKDFLEPDRIVVGVDNPNAEAVLREVYRHFIQNEHPFLVTSIKSAEVIKYASNAFLATKISFINEIANFCEEAGASIDDVASGMGLDSRIGQKYLHAGLGYGGSCFPKDVKALLASGKDMGRPFELLRAVERINERQRLRIIDKLSHHLGSLSNRTIAIWGLAFKAKTDDIREAPSLAIITKLLELGTTITVFDPVVKKLPFPLTVSETQYDCLDRADALLILTEWDDFLYPDFSSMKEKLNAPYIIIDGRNMYDPKAVREQGFIYDSIGRPE